MRSIIQFDKGHKSKCFWFYSNRKFWGSQEKTEQKSRYHLKACWNKRENSWLKMFFIIFFSWKQNRLDFVCRNFGNRIFTSKMKIYIHVVRNFYSRMQICVNPSRRDASLKINIIENSFISDNIILWWV